MSVPQAHPLLAQSWYNEARTIIVPAVSSFRFPGRGGVRGVAETNLPKPKGNQGVGAKSFLAGPSRWAQVVKRGPVGKQLRRAPLPGGPPASPDSRSGYPPVAQGQQRARAAVERHASPAAAGAL